ncbi:MAG TPA: hypothetical protein DEB10_13570 [Ruminococcaceae bacterium]|nr:hypothetical protein [Oscillospiraceae bacterium]HCA29239.1 hypothetical protein [Oscillospiraceae bacterium]
MKIKKMAIVLSAIMALSTLGGLSTSANNSTDTVYSFTTISTGWIYFTETRAKEDASGSYAYYVQGATQPNGTYFSIWSGGTNYTRNETATLYVGQKRRIAQFVYENGKRNCYLGVSPRDYNSSKIAGLWSPDSVGSDPYAN